LSVSIRGFHVPTGVQTVYWAAHVRDWEREPEGTISLAGDRPGPENPW